MIYKGTYSTRPDCPSCGNGSLIGQIYGNLIPPYGTGNTECDYCRAHITLFFEEKDGLNIMRAVSGKPKSNVVQ